jgi:hypothetical protein
MAGLRTFSADVETLAAHWRQRVETDSDWKPTGNAGDQGGEAAGYFVTSGTLNGYAKPSKIDASLGRAAHEKIAAPSADLSYGPEGCGRCCDGTDVEQNRGAGSRSSSVCSGSNSGRFFSTRPTRPLQPPVITLPFTTKIPRKTNSKQNITLEASPASSALGKASRKSSVLHRTTGITAGR